MVGGILASIALAGWQQLEVVLRMATQQHQLDEAVQVASSSEKRKRDDEDANGEPDNKKARSEESPHIKEEPVEPQRDREHTTVVVKNLPQEASEQEVRKFFRQVSTILAEF